MKIPNPLKANVTSAAIGDYPAVFDVLARGGLLDLIGRDCVFETKAEAIRAIYARLDSERCRICAARIFAECQTVLPNGVPRAAV